MGQPYKIKHGLVVGDKIVEVTGHDKKAYYNSNELATEVDVAALDTRITDLDTTHSSDVENLNTRINDNAADSTAYADGIVTDLDTRITTNTNNIGDPNNLLVTSPDLVTAINLDAELELLFDHADFPTLYNTPDSRYQIPDDVTKFMFSGNEDDFFCEISSTRTKPLIFHADHGASGIFLFAETWDTGGNSTSGHLRILDATGMFDDLLSQLPNTTKSAIYFDGNITIEQLADEYTYGTGVRVWGISSHELRSNPNYLFSYPFGDVGLYLRSPVATQAQWWGSNNQPEILNNTQWKAVSNNFQVYSFSSDGQNINVASQSPASHTAFERPSYFYNPHGFSSLSIALNSEPSNGTEHNVIINGSMTISSVGSGYDMIVDGVNKGTSFSADIQSEYRFIFNSGTNQWIANRTFGVGILTGVGQGRFEMRGWLNVNPTIAANNTIIGDPNGSNIHLATGIKNVGVGESAINNLTSGTENVAVGYQALFAPTNGSRNIAIGSGATVSSTGSNDRIAIGYGASSSADQHCAITHSDAGKDYTFSLNSTTGYSNSLVYFNEDNDNALNYGLVIDTFATTPLYIFDPSDGNRLVLTAERATSNLTVGGKIIAAENWLFTVATGGTTTYNTINTGTHSGNRFYGVNATGNTHEYVFDFTTADLVIGNFLSFFDVYGAFNTNNIEITINNQPLEGVAAPNTVFLDVDDTITKFVYLDASYGWKRITMLNQ